MSCFRFVCSVYILFILIIFYELIQICNFYDYPVYSHFYLSVDSDFLFLIIISLFSLFIMICFMFIVFLRMCLFSLFFVIYLCLLISRFVFFLIYQNLNKLINYFFCLFNFSILWFVFQFMSFNFHCFPLFGPYLWWFYLSYSPPRYSGFFSLLVVCSFFF